MDARLRLFGSFALLGTARRSPSFPEADFPSGSLVRDIVNAAQGSPESSARALLCGAGALCVCGLAGHLPPLRDGELFIPALCPEETREVLPEDSPVTDVLGEIFRGGRLRLQHEALRHLEKKNMVLPPCLLPSALVMGRGAPALRPLLARTAGARGLWLASLNPDWRMFASSSDGEPDIEAWEHGRPMQRQAFFQAMRRADAAGARDLFEKDMATMDASERQSLLGLFEHGLSLEDEDLLERLLFRDRSREVRRTAASLLSRLPGSRYLERMGERLSSCMKGFLAAPAPSFMSRVAAAVTGRSLSGAELVVPPEAYDKAWAEDLISEKSPVSQFGPRAGWLYQMASAVPLSWWTERTGREPDELLALSERSEWKKPLQTAWGDAELRCRDENWARAMLKAMKKDGAWPSASSGSLDAFSLAGMLSREERERVWEGMLSPQSLPALLTDMCGRQEPGYVMSAALAAKAVSALKDRLTSARSRDYALASVIDELAMLLPLEEMESVERMFASFPDRGGDVADRFSSVARQRVVMGAYFS